MLNPALFAPIDCVPELKDMIQDIEKASDNFKKIKIFINYHYFLAFLSCFSVYLGICLSLFVSGFFWALVIIGFLLVILYVVIGGCYFPKMISNYRNIAQEILDDYNSDELNYRGVHATLTFSSPKNTQLRFFIHIFRNPESAEFIGSEGSDESYEEMRVYNPIPIESVDLPSPDATEGAPNRNNWVSDNNQTAKSEEKRKKPSG